MSVKNYTNFKLLFFAATGLACNRFRFDLPGSLFRLPLEFKRRSESAFCADGTQGFDGRTWKRPFDGHRFHQ